MISAEEINKIKDYIKGLKEVSVSKSLPVGSILVKEEDRTAVLKIIQENEVLLVENSSNLKEEIERLARTNKIVGLSVLKSNVHTIVKSLSGLLFNGKENWQGAVILIICGEEIEEMPLGEIVTSFYRPG